MCLFNKLLRTIKTTANAVGKLDKIKAKHSKFSTQ
jgi:hypothetical protein